MAIEATIFPVMIASPGDVSEEREVVRSTLNNWNSLNSLHEAVVMLPLGWETHAAPDLAGRAQDLINDRILEKCDLLIGVFWTRLGTPTGEHESGTVEEIKEHVAAGKTAMIYFSSRPIVPGSYDEEQFEKVLEFKEWCKSKGIISGFHSTDDFRAKFKDDLAMILRDSEYLNSLTEVSDPISSKDDIEVRTVQLSELSIELLVKASKSKNGTLMMLKHLGGTSFQAGNESIDHDGSAREIARLEAAVEELENYGLIRDAGFKREIFNVTNDGFEAAERNGL